MPRKWTIDSSLCQGINWSFWLKLYYYFFFLIYSLCYCHCITCNIKQSLITNLYIVNMPCILWWITIEYYLFFFTNFQVSTKAIKNIKEDVGGGVPLWVYILAIVGGLILLIIIIIALWRVGSSFIFVSISLGSDADVSGMSCL